MKFFVHGFVVILFFLFPSSAFADVRLAVLEFRGNGIAEDLLEILSDEVRTGVLSVSSGKKVNGEDLIIMTRENMLAVLADQGLTAEDCTGTCEVEIAKNIGADYVISGTLNQIDELFVLTIKIHETSKSNLLGSETIKTEDKKELMSEAERAGALMFYKAMGVQGGGETANMPKGFSGEELEAWKASGATEMISTFDSNPNGPGVTVLVDGVLLCTETPCTQTITSGPHDISIQKKRYKPWSESILFTKGKNVKAKLVADFGKLTLKTKPAGIQFLLNKEKITTPIKNKILEKGPYKLQIDDPCYVGKKGQSYQFQIAEDDHEKIDFESIPRTAGIKVRVKDNSNTPVEADIFVDGKAIGKSPGTYTVGVCSKELRASISGQEATTKLKLVERETATHELVLKNRFENDVFSMPMFYGRFIHTPATGADFWGGTAIIVGGANFRGLGVKIAEIYLNNVDSDAAFFSVLPLYLRSPKILKNLQLEYEFHWLWHDSYADSWSVMPAYAPVHMLSSRFTFGVEDGIYYNFGPTISLDGSNNIGFGGFLSMTIAAKEGEL